MKKKKAYRAYRKAIGKLTSRRWRGCTWPGRIGRAERSSAPLVCSISFKPSSSRLQFFFLKKRYPVGLWQAQPKPNRLKKNQLLGFAQQLFKSSPTALSSELGLSSYAARAELSSQVEALGSAWLEFFK